MNNHLIPAAGYIRMSTDKQEDSPARQRNDIEALAERLGYRIVTWYEDHGITGTESANRPEFLRLLEHAKAGKFQAILLSEQSRMSREDIFDVMVHWRLLRKAGVKIVTCQRGELDFDNLGGVITAIVDQYGAREESVKLAHRVVSGQRLKAKQGQRLGGMVYGYDREVFDEAGNLVRRVHFHERFRKPATWKSRLVPSSDRRAVEAVQWAFDAICHGHSVGHVAREFKRRGLKTTYHNEFDYSSTRGMLKNPTYAGVARAGVQVRAKFCSLGASGLIVVEDAHEALVSKATFDDVQRIINGRKRRHERTTGRYLLTVTCGHCGRKMYGVRRKASPGHKGGLYYFCDNNKLNRDVDPNCPHPSVRVERLEEFVLAAIREHLLERGAEKAIREAITRVKSRTATQSTRDEKLLKEIRRKIERGTENLALAGRDDFSAIAKLLERWRAEEAELQQRIDRRASELEPIPEALKLIGRLARIRSRLDLADRKKLAYAIGQTVESLTICLRKTKTGQVEHVEAFGELRFHEALGCEPIPIPDEAIGRRKVWREIGQLVRQSDHPLHLADFAKHIGTKDLSRAAHHVRRAESAGLMRKVGHQGGWVPAK